jgi:DNA-binding NarL/FixJ family response regulator
LYQNTFTYHGHRRAVRKWSVKIQFKGRRQAFSLRASEPEAAAVEACEIYRLLCDNGWAAAAGYRPSGPRPRSPATTGDRSRAEYWRQQLVHRDYTSELHPGVAAELSARIDHAGTSHYFPLGTSSIERAARKATGIYQAIVARGWPAVSERFPRELTIAFHWTDRPLAWTYTTIHTRIAERAAPSPPPGPRLRVSVVESDEGVRRALEWCVERQPGLACAAGFGTAAAALRGLTQGEAHLAIVGQSLSDRAGVVCLEELNAKLPLMAGVLYSVYEDSEELFKTTPGGAGSYLLRRTRPTQLLEPVAGTLGKGDFSRAEITLSIWQYFKETFADLPLGSATPHLTNLTQREHEVLGLLSKGQPDKEIAERLRISVWTVHGHVRKILEKLGVHNRTGAVVKYLQK